MSLTDRSIYATAPVSLDRELETLQHVVARSRANRWNGGDVIDVELEGLLATLTNPIRPADMTYGADMEPSPVWRTHRNSWREVLDEVE